MNKEIKIVFRKPEFPVLFIENDNLDSYNNLDDLCIKLLNYNNNDDNKLLIIDSSAEEFWFVVKDNTYILAPGFMIQKKTKKEIIEIYNNSKKGKINSYNNKNLSNIRLNKLIEEICSLIQND